MSPAAPLDPNSTAYVNQLASQVSTYGPWINTSSYSVPVYVVPSGQATQTVTLNSWGPDLQSEFNAVPIPSGARAANGSDAQMTVWQPSADKMWEFWQMKSGATGWAARWGGEMDSVSTSPGYFTHSGLSSNWGATATGLPLLGGLITFADLQRGYIDHALALGVPVTTASIYSWPAQRTDGFSTAPGISSIPEGTRFRLDPSLKIATLNLSPLGQMLAQAAQTYGIVVRDTAGAVVFYGQDPTGLAPNPWKAAYNGKYPNQILAHFPWSSLETLQSSLSG